MAFGDKGSDLMYKCFSFYAILVLNKWDEGTIS